MDYFEYSYAALRCTLSSAPKIAVRRCKRYRVDPRVSRTLIYPGLLLPMSIYIDAYAQLAPFFQRSDVVFTGVGCGAFSVWKRRIDIILGEDQKSFIELLILFEYNLIDE